MNESDVMLIWLYRSYLQQLTERTFWRGAPRELNTMHRMILW